jgi:uncharacterized protein (DUF58 family)
MRQRSPAADPSLASFGALLDAVRGLRWRARHPARLAVPGIHPSHVRGTSAEFTEYRPYRQGDEVRRIDWRLLARTDRAQIRLSEERAVTPTMLVLDASASLAFPANAQGISKWKMACELAVGLAAVAHAGGDPVGVVVAGETTRTLPPRTRRGTVGDLIRVVADTCVSGSAPVAPALRGALRGATRVVVITDLLGDADEILRAAHEGTVAGRDVHALHVIAREELDPPAGMLIVQDPEDAAVRRPLSATARVEYVRAYGAWRGETAERWLASGAAYRAIVTDAEPTAHVVRRIARNEPMRADTAVRI